MSPQPERSVDVPGNAAKSDKPSRRRGRAPKNETRAEKASDFAASGLRSASAPRTPSGTAEPRGGGAFQGDSSPSADPADDDPTKMISTKMAATTTWPDDEQRSAPRAPHDEDRPHDDDDEVSHVEEGRRRARRRGPGGARRAPWRLPGGRSRDQRSQCPAAPCGRLLPAEGTNPHWRPCRRGLARGAGLLHRLHAFEELLQAGEYMKAAVLASDIQAAIASSTRSRYFPTLSSGFLGASASHMRPLETCLKRAARCSSQCRSSIRSRLKSSCASASHALRGPSSQSRVFDRSRQAKGCLRYL